MLTNSLPLDTVTGDWWRGWVHEPRAANQNLSWNWSITTRRTRFSPMILLHRRSKSWETGGCFPRHLHCLGKNSSGEWSQLEMKSKWQEQAGGANFRLPIYHPGSWIALLALWLIHDASRLGSPDILLGLNDLKSFLSLKTSWLTLAQFQREEIIYIFNYT
jgi:hypothetical protein